MVMNRMMMKKCILLIVVTAIAFFWGCQENPVELNSEGATLVTDTLYATFDSTYVRDSLVVSTWSSTRLLLGHAENLEFRIALRFSTFPANVDVQAAWIEFTDLDTTPRPMMSGFSVTGYPVDSSWATDVDAIWGDDFRNNVNFGIPVGDMAVDFDPNTSEQFVFNAAGLEFVNRWVDTTFVDTVVVDPVTGDTLTQVANAGILLDFDSNIFTGSPDALKEFEARISGTDAGPRLFLQYLDDNDSLVVDTSFAANDIYFFEGDFQPVADRTHTSTLIPWVSLYDFDVDSLRRKYGSQFIVSSANFQLPIDRENSALSSSFGPGLRMMPYTFSDEDGAGPNDVVINTSVLASLQDVQMTVVTADSNYVEAFDGTDRSDLAQAYVQVQLNDPSLIKGFYVEHSLLSAYVGNFAFYTATSAPDPTLRPRIIVESLLLPSERF